MDLVEPNSEEATTESNDSPSNRVSIVHVNLPQSQVQSVIQPTSVIQSTPSLQTTTLSTKGNLILVGKANSVIHPTGVQVVEAEEGATKKRREILARRPSYRKILNDLGGCEISVEERSESPEGLETGFTNSATGLKQNQTISVGATHYQTAAGLLKVIPAGALQLATVSGTQGLGEGQSLPTLAMTNTSGGGTIVHYAQGQDGQLFVPVCVAGDVQAYALRPVTSAGVVVGTSSATSPTLQSYSEDSNRKRDRLMKGSSGSGGNNSDEWEMSEPALQKRELRLMKNREAARECRRKKKEYIKCLENRVAVLENQNKALIEELKSLKELYCNQKSE